MSEQNRNLLIVVGVLVVFLLLGPVLMGGMMGPGLFGPSMMGWGFTGGNAATANNGWLWGLAMGVGGLMMLAFWGAIIVGIVLFVRWIAGQGTSTSGSSTTEDPFAILQRRYAAGEIDQQTYEHIRAEFDTSQARFRETRANPPVAGSGQGAGELVGASSVGNKGQASVNVVGEGSNNQDGWPW